MTAPGSRRSRLTFVAAALLTAALTTAGCSGGSDDSDSSGATDSGAAGGSAPERSAVADQAAMTPIVGPGGKDRSGTSVGAAFSPSLIKTGAVELESQDIAKVLAKIDGLAASTGGQIASEETATDDDGERVSSRIELKVPVARFDDALDALTGFGDLVSVNSSTKDVTAAVADVDSRVQSAKDSIDQLRALFARATRLRDVIALEHELSAREADLESLQAQQRDLSASTTMSTIVINLSRPDVTTPATEHRSGFLAGLQSGWDGLVTFVVATAHGLGVVLPLGTLALLLALLLRLAVLRFRPRQLPRSSE